MSWIELSLDTTNEAIDWVCTLLSGTNYTGEVHIREYFDEDTVDNQWTFTIFLYLAQNVQTNASIEKIANLLLPLQRTGLCNNLRTAVVEEITQTEEKSPLVHRIGKRFVVLTNDLPDEFSSNEVIIRLKNTLAFGSGLHPATNLCLQLLERYIVPQMNILDLGSGSGILSVACAKLGANVLAVDNDSIAVESTQDAVRRNGVEQKVRVMKGSLGQGSELGHWMGLETSDNAPTIKVTETFDLIVANILARMHIALAADFRLSLQRNYSNGGVLILAGFTTDYEDAVAAALTDVGFEAVDCERLDEWVAQAYRLKHQVQVS
ncbi:50S ribosomal protein L11 methyltransferase [Iningainema tapete]|uniref:50S ribosomal protein L11 methyltransferase n=1 Tax=Iningainema tapete BLCC-T55 TaxID=2748662 RepID=A0A8J6XER0_9CYAN|nr:50S ribosomal protein L11 methyltransferase [Iningainema tapete]MBD2771237.1 50S ribosomal protein L11 methyltransferase [Iningainema tapete BLCC-T55]